MKPWRLAAADAVRAAHAAALAAFMIAFIERTLPACGLLATRDPPTGQQLTLKELADDALGTSRPPRRGHRATRIESEVGIMVG